MKRLTRRQWILANIGLLIGIAIIATPFVLVYVLWIVPYGGGDFLGGNVESTGLFILQWVAILTLLPIIGGAILFIYIYSAETWTLIVIRRELRPQIRSLWRFAVLGHTQTTLPRYEAEIGVFS
jgi:hypothetical protein